MNAAVLAAGYLLDILVGDPPRLPHPVRGVGWMIATLETLTRRWWPRHERLAGTVTVLLTLAVTALTVGGSCALAAAVDPWAGAVLTVLWLALGFSTRSLSDHARRIAVALANGDLPAARTRVGMIVGRDTAALDAGGISRAAVESVAESTVDGVLSPLFFAILGGPVGLWLFKAVSTCDSMIGHKDARYIRFGTFGARLDDVFNYLPARLALVLFPAAAALTGADSRQAWRIGLRDHHRHASPNAGIPEAAMAGALNIRLGGPATYDGLVSDNPTFGEEFPAPAPADVTRSIRLMWCVSFMAFAIGLAVLVIQRPGFTL